MTITQSSQTQINQDLITHLKKSGLSDKAALVYMAVLEMGSAFPSKIAEQTKLNRSTVYKILLDLSVKGLISEIEKNKKLCYQVERPTKLVSFAKQQIRLAEEHYEQIQKILPEVEGLFSILPQKPKVRFFEGVAGVMSVYEDHVAPQPKYEMVAWSNTGALLTFLPKRFLEEYVLKKAKLGITSRGILPDSAVDINYNKTIYRRVDKRFWPQLKHVSAKLFPYTSEITVYGKNKVSIVNWHDQAMIGVIIEDATIHNMMRMIFELSWK